MTTLRAALGCFILAAVFAPAAPLTSAAGLKPRETSATARSETPTRVGAWETLAEMPTARAQLTAVADPVNNRIYVMGGYVEELGTPLSTVEIYDPATDTWSTGPSLPIATRGAAGVYYGGRIFLFGGVLVDAEPSVQILDVASGVWTTRVFAEGGWELGAAVLGNKIYVAGGDGGRESQLVEFDPSTLAASPKADMPVGHKLFDLAAIGGALYAVGGIGAGFSAHASVESYDPAADAWSAATADLPAARSSYASGVIGNLLFVAGGSTILFNGQPPRFNTLLVYDATTGAWTNGPIMPDYIRELAGATLNGKFYVFGGWSGFGAAPTAYTVAAGTGPGPGITCPPDVTVTANQGDICGMSAVVTYPAPTAPPGSSVTCSPPSGSTFHAGTTAVTCTATDAEGNASTCQFSVAVLEPATTCAIDDASGDVFREVVDRASPLYGSWVYYVPATGEAMCGRANRIGYRPGISLTSSDTDDPRYAMTAQFNYATRTATAMVTDRATNRRFALRDRDLGNSPCH